MEAERQRLAALEAERETERQRLATLEAEREAERQKWAAMEAKAEQDRQQMAQVLTYVWSLVMTQGGEIPPFLLGQQLPTPPQHDSTPVSMMNVLVSLNAMFLRRPGELRCWTPFWTPRQVSRSVRRRHRHTLNFHRTAKT
jgi:hypothetical protein